MKMYRVNVNGNVYEITLEVVDAAEVKAAPAPAAAPAPVVSTVSEVAAPAATPAPAAAPAVSGDGEPVTSPMPGNIMDVRVQVGQKVKSGEILFILEAMKMENEIMADQDGTVAQVLITKGASVNSGDVLCVLN